MTDSKKHTLHAMALEACYWMGNCAYGAYVVTMLTDCGYSAATASALMTFVAVVSFIVQPLTGYLCDNFFPQRSVFMLLVGCSIPLYLLFNSSMQSLPLTILCMFMLTLCMQQLPGLVDSWILRMQKDDPNINYGLCRGTASLMYATASLIMGSVTTAYGHHARMIIGACMSVLAVLVAFTIKGHRPASKAEKSGEKPAPAKHMSTLETFKVMSQNKTYMLVLLMAFAIWLGSSCTSTFLPTLVKELGGDSGLVGTAFSIIAYSEVPAMFLTSRILRRFKTKNVVLFACAAYVLRMGMTCLAPNLTVLLLMQPLQGISYAILWPTCITYVNQIVEERVKSTSVMTFTSVTLGISGIFANAIGTAILSATGNVRMVFLYATCAVSVGLLIAVYGRLRKLWK